MKKTLRAVVFIMVMFLSTGAMATGLGNSNNNNQNHNHNSAMSKNTNINTVSNRVQQTQLQGQKQVQFQNQGQYQGQKTDVGGQANTQKVYEEREYLAVPNIVPYETPLIQGGKMGDFTGALPQILGIKALDKAKDVVVKVVVIYNGNIFSRIRLAEVEETLLESVANLKSEGRKLDKIRYQVWWLDSASSGGVGGGFAGGMSGADPVAGTASILPGYHVSTFNPQFVIKFFEIQ